jgi:hypothetical protein
MRMGHFIAKNVLFLNIFIRKNVNIVHEAQTQTKTWTHTHIDTDSNFKIWCLDIDASLISKHA